MVVIAVAWNMYGLMRIQQKSDAVPPLSEFEAALRKLEGGVPSPDALLIGTSIFGLVGLILFLWMGRRAVEAIRARKYGTAEWADVVRVREVRERAIKLERRVIGYKLEWRCRQGDLQASFRSRTPERYDRYPPRTKIEVFRDSRGKTWWVGDVGPRTAAASVPDVGKSAS